MLYGIGPNDRMFTVTKSYLHREMDRGAKEAGVPRIRIHDIRHSAVSLLIDMGFSATAIADRVGHESIDITYNYAHLFPSKQAEMADKLNMEKLTLLLPYYPPERSIPTLDGFDGTFYPPGMESVPRKAAIIRANRYVVDHVDYLIAYVWHPASNARELAEYAESREKKGSLIITLIKPND